MFVLGWVVKLSVVVIAAYYVYRMGLSVAILRAVRAGDDERAERLREREIRHRVRVSKFFVVALGLTAIASITLVVVSIAKQ